MGQDDDDEKVKGQNLARMNLIVKRIESELDQLKNLINLQIDGLITTNPSTTNYDRDSHSHSADGNCDTSISSDTYCLVDTIKIEDDPPIDNTAEDDDKVLNSNSNYQNEFNYEDQEVDCQNRPSNENELILGGVDFNCEISSKENETHVNLQQSSSNFTSFQDQDLKPAVDSFQISNENLLEGILEVAAKNDKKLRQKLIVQMGVRCDKNPIMLNSYRPKISPPRQSKTDNSQKDAKLVDFLSKSKKSAQKSKNCPFCSKYFEKFNALSIHMRVHTGERPFKCKFCSKSFTTKENLKTHSRVHTGERPYSCSICSKKFAQIATRDMHMKTHTGERPFSCTVCSKSFIQFHHRKAHMRTHTGVKPFSCSDCSKSFALSHQRKRHIMLVHKGEKPFSCSVCFKKFALVEHLNRHIRLMHKDPLM